MYCPLSRYSFLHSLPADIAKMANICRPQSRPFVPPRGYQGEEEAVTEDEEAVTEDDEDPWAVPF